MYVASLNPLKFSTVFPFPNYFSQRHAVDLKFHMIFPYPLPNDCMRVYYVKVRRFCKPILSLHVVRSILSLANWSEAIGANVYLHHRQTIYHDSDARQPHNVT